VRPGKSAGRTRRLDRHVRCDDRARARHRSRQVRVAKGGIGGEVTAYGGGRAGDSPSDPHDVLSILDDVGSPATMAMAGRRFFGFVIGGTLPIALAANWLATAWDQNSALAAVTPGTAAFEQTALRWLSEALGLPPDCGGGFVTGATMASFTALPRPARPGRADRALLPPRPALCGGAFAGRLPGAQRRSAQPGAGLVWRRSDDGACDQSHPGRRHMLVRRDALAGAGGYADQRLLVGDHGG
jgi:hypothetical protein